MTRLKMLGLGAAALSLAATGVAFAQGASDTATPEKPAVTRHDGERHADRTITKDEFGSIRADRLKAADKNGDGTLSKDEIEDMVMKRMIERRANRLERRLDIDGDGKVTLAEIDQHQAKRFAVMDRNNDGKIEPRERRMARREKHHGHRHHMARHHHGAHHQKHMAGHHDGAMQDKDTAAPSSDDTSAN